MPAVIGWLTTTGGAASLSSDDDDDILADLLSSGSEDDDQVVNNKPKLKLVSSRMQPATADKGMKIHGISMNVFGFCFADKWHTFYFSIGK